MLDCLGSTEARRKTHADGSSFCRTINSSSAGAGGSERLGFEEDRFRLAVSRSEFKYSSVMGSSSSSSELLGVEASSERFL